MDLVVQWHERFDTYFGVCQLGARRRGTMRALERGGQIRRPNRRRKSEDASWANSGRGLVERAYWDEMVRWRRRGRKPRYVVGGGVDRGRALKGIWGGGVGQTGLGLKHIIIIYRIIISYY